MFFISAGILITDQVTKWIVKTTMQIHQSIPVIGDSFFRITYIENDGIAFGIFFGGRLFLVIFTFMAVIFLLFYMIKIRNEPLFPQIALSFILGGALGNLMDRLFRGQVVDFLDFDFPDIIMVRWPVFNVADSCVSVGMTLLLIYLLFFESKKKQNPPEADDDAAAARDGISGS